MDEVFMSFYLKAYRIHIFADALRGIGSPQRICFMLDKDGDSLLLVPYSKRDFRSHGVSPDAYSRNRGVEVSSMKLCALLANRHGWDMSKSYRVPGRVSQTRAVVFDLKQAKEIASRRWCE